MADVAPFITKMSTVFLASEVSNYAEPICGLRVLQHFPACVFSNKRRYTLIIMKSLRALRAKKIFIRQKLGVTAVSAIKASSVTLLTWQKEPVENTVNLQFLTWQSFLRLI